MKLTLEIDPLSAASQLRNARLRVSFQENAGYKLETFVTRCGDVCVVFVVATKSAMVKLAKKIDESASDVACYGMVSGVDVSPRPADCGLPVDGMALVEFVVQGSSQSRKFPQGRHGSASHPREAERVKLLAEVQLVSCTGWA